VKKRINRYLAQCGLGSRRKVEQLVTEGKVKINDILCTDLATEVDENKDVVAVSGKIVKPETEMIYLLMNKPKGYLVTKKDDFNRKTVFDLLPGLTVNLFAVGRLDKDSEGLLLLTNDGDFADRVLHPRNKLGKLYKVTVNGFVTDDDVVNLRKGIDIDGQKTLPARVFVKSRRDNITVLKITIYEGRNRQIRKMIEKLGYSVSSLKRLQIGEINMRNLPAGMCRVLKPAEILSIIRAGKQTAQSRNKK